MKKIGILLITLSMMIATGCGGGGGDTVAVFPSSSKAITSFSLKDDLLGPYYYQGTIDQTAKTISVYMPFTTTVTSLKAAFTTTGASVRVGATIQTSTTTANDFSAPVVYTVTAANASTQNYTVTVTKTTNPLNSGFIDTTFGTGGKVTTSIGSYDDLGRALAIQADDKIVMAGSSDNGTNFDFALARYTSTGNLDAAFGSGGKVITPVGSGIDTAYATAIQADGKIVVAGSSHNGTDFDFALVRYNTNGTPDLTFGAGGTGKVTTAIGIHDDIARAIAIQADGKIVVAGYTYNGTDFDFALVRYNTNGSPDITFDADGKVTTAIGGAYDAAYALVIQADQQIVAAGYSNNGSYDDFALVRYNPNGSLDNTFDADGKVTTAVGSAHSAAGALAIQGDGKLVAAGVSYNASNSYFALARYNTNGSLDNTFNADGKVTTAFGGNNDAANAVAIQADGKIVVAGYSSIDGNFDFALARYNTNGSLDTDFYITGKVTTAVGSGWDAAYAVGLQTGGKIVAAGQSENGSKYDFALVRYLP